MPTTVRRIRSSDAHAYREIRLRALAESPTAFASTFESESRHLEEHWRDASLRRAASPDEAIFLAMDHHEHPVGLVGIFRPRPGVDVAELVSMWVSPEERRTGIGRRLVGAAVQWASDVGFDGVELWVTRGNDGARLLYERCGFSTTGQEQALPSDPRLTEARMRLPLNRGS